jgi:membrane dipeptidase
MNSIPNHEFLELHQFSQHPSHCKQQCFVFTEIADIDLPPEITKFNPEKLKNGSIRSYSNKSKMDTISPIPPNKNVQKGKKIVAIVSGLLLCLLLVAAIPIGLQLRSSSLLEARLAFIR